MKLVPESSVDLPLQYATSGVRSTLLSSHQKEELLAEAVTAKDEDVIVPEWLVRMTERLKSRDTRKKGEPTSADEKTDKNHESSSA